MLRPIICLEVPYAKNEQQFLLQAVERALKAFRSTNSTPADNVSKIPAVCSPTHESSSPIRVVGV